jgi:hypothetical protein
MIFAGENLVGCDSWHSSAGAAMLQFRRPSCEAWKGSTNNTLDKMGNVQEHNEGSSPEPVAFNARALSSKSSL